eukprot:CAMPEP_0174761806 /NCGR_PEP_ID=MMETSP1094-20130205/109460_1 /TAXON_ID=156173 /ORGANISM="Chrysochromulina brevifilum, Strain UTEX LB 985" /LENGTH=152 /DNA_ID=CAMNT_0015967753 /DNA_START=425 /DNA_END=882 /DNA_ORIENTATION=+
MARSPVLAQWDTQDVFHGVSSTALPIEQTTEAGAPSTAVAVYHPASGVQQHTASISLRAHARKRFRPGLGPVISVTAAIDRAKGASAIPRAASVDPSILQAHSLAAIARCLEGHISPASLAFLSLRPVDADRQLLHTSRPVYAALVGTDQPR